MIELKHLISLIIIIAFMSCKKDNPLPEDIDVRQEMRIFVKEISTYSKSKNTAFLIIPQNGQELLTDDGNDDGLLIMDYVNAIDATGREDLNYGYDGIDQNTETEAWLHMFDLCLLAESNGIKVLVTDYCYSIDKIDDSYIRNEGAGFIPFAASNRELNNIPSYPGFPVNENTIDIDSLSKARNFLYLINPENYSTKQEFINALEATNYDILIIDLFFNEEILTVDDIELLKTKNNGSRRLVISYVSIGEAEDYRYYWNNDWKNNPPSWLEKENSSWAGNYKVRYWDDNWKNIIYGSSNAYIDKIIDTGFDGAYLDIIDGFEYFEEEYNIK
jgi:cysteinyl-tRNA synthetase